MLDILCKIGSIGGIALVLIGAFGGLVIGFIITAQYVWQMISK